MNENSNMSTPTGGTHEAQSLQKGRLNDKAQMESNQDISYVYYEARPDHHQFAKPFENVIFYEEPLDEESYDHELIEELFNAQRKIRVSKDKRDGSPGRSLAG